MEAKFVVEKEQNRIEINKLEVQREDLKRSYVKQRNNIEEDSWLKIDSLVDQNKTKLDVSIELSMVAKGQLTETLKDFRELKQDKEQKVREMEEKNQNFNEHI